MSFVLKKRTKDKQRVRERKRKREIVERDKRVNKGRYRRVSGEENKVNNVPRRL